MKPPIFSGSGSDIAEFIRAWGNLFATQEHSITIHNLMLVAHKLQIVKLDWL